MPACAQATQQVLAISDRPPQIDAATEKKNLPNLTVSMNKNKQWIKLLFAIKRRLDIMWLKTMPIEPLIKKTNQKSTL